MERPDYTVNMVTYPADGAPFVPYLGTFALPERFDVTWIRDDLPYQVTMTIAVVTGRPLCVRLTCTPHVGGEDVDSAGLRQVPVGRLLAAALSPPNVWVSENDVVRRIETVGELNGFKKARRSERPRERWQLTDEHLREVAEVYRSALSSPVIAVGERWDKPRNSARRWVAEARDRGFLERTSHE